MRVHARDIAPMAITLGVLLGMALMIMDAQAQGFRQQQQLNGATMAQKLAAERKAASWLESLGAKGLTVDGGRFRARYVGRHRDLIAIHDRGWYVTLGFTQALEPGMDAAAWRNAFRFVSLARIPTPGLAIRHWRITPMTAKSSTGEGVTFSGGPDGSIKLRVKAKFFALYGQDTRTNVPADAPTPQEAYFSIRKPFCGDLTMTLKLEK